MRFPCRLATALTVAVLAVAMLAIAPVRAVAGEEDEDRDRRARAALAIAEAEAKAKAKKTAAAAAAGLPPVAPDPRPVAPKYPEAHKKAVEGQKPLVVFVSCPDRKIEGADTCQTDAPTFGDAQGPCVAICVPLGGRLHVDSTLPSGAKSEVIQRAVEKAQQKLGDGPPRQMPAAPAPLNTFIQAGPAGCVCGVACNCPAGECPAKCPVCSGATLAPVVVGYRYERVCTGTGCQLVSVPVYGQASTTPAAAVTTGDALDEVNAKRAARGLRPFVRDEGLTRAAEACAQFRAANRLFGHVGGQLGDFAFLPPGVKCDATGCAAYPPSYGWLSCCTYDPYTVAGAAWVMGADGNRYMQLCVRAR